MNPATHNNINEKRRWIDELVEVWIGYLLRGGVLLAAAWVLAGGILYLRQNGAAPSAYHAFRGEPSDLKSMAGILDDAWSLDSRGIIQLGLLILIATPVARVAFSVVAFAIERDWLYVGVTLVVLALLIWSLTGVRL